MRVLLRRLIAVPMGLVFIGALSGCWDRQELSELGIVSASSMDVTDSGRWKMGFQLVIPSSVATQNGSTGSSAAPVNVFSTEGESMRGAASRATQEMSRSLYFGHNQVQVISEKAARIGIGPLLDLYVRNGSLRETAMLFVTEGEARPILEQLMPMEKISGNALSRLVELEQRSGGSFRPQNVYQVLLDLLGPVRATAIPGIVISGSGEGGSSPADSQQTSVSSNVRLQRLALFRDDKMVGWVSTHDSRGLLWLRNEARSAVVSFPCSKGEPKRNSVQLTAIRTKTVPRQEGSGWHLKASVQAEGILTEYNCPGNLVNPEALHTIEGLVEAEVRSDMESGLKAAQGLKADVGGVGEKVRRSYPALWKSIGEEWNERLFPAMTSEFDVRVELDKTGRSNVSYEEAGKESRERK